MHHIDILKRYKDWTYFFQKNLIAKHGLIAKHTGPKTMSFLQFILTFIADEKNKTVM